MKRWTLAISLAGAVTVALIALVPSDVLAAEPGTAGRDLRLPPPCIPRSEDEPLTVLTVRLRNALDEAALAPSVVEARSRGTACVGLNGVPARVRHASVVDVRVPSDASADLDALGTTTAAVADAFKTVLSSPTSDSTLGPHGPTITLTLESPATGVRLVTSWTRLLAARDQGLTGAALLDVLGYTP